MFAFQRIFTFAVLSISLAEARFGQENAVQGIIAAIGGNNGQAATLAGQSISTLLAGSNACDKLRLADQVAQLEGNGVLEAAKALVQAEKNFNPFAVDRPNICNDANLPENPALKGILPLIDPAVEGADAVNAASAASLNNPLNQAGSQAQLLASVGFTTFNAQNSAGNVVAGANLNAGGNAGGNAGNNGNGGNGNGNNGNGNNGNGNNGNGGNGQVVQCPAGTVPVQQNPNQNQGNTTAPGRADAQGNLQSFRGNIGSAIDAIVFSGNRARPFQVADSTFVNFEAAATRSCDRQFNACANAANAGAQGFSFQDCVQQKADCETAQDNARVRAFNIKRRARRSMRSRAAKRAALHA